jgi:hypothetical protein
LRDVGLFVGSVVLNVFKRLVEFTWRIVLVKVNVLDCGVAVSGDAGDGLAESLLEELRAVLGGGSDTLLKATGWVLLHPFVHAEFSELVHGDDVHVAGRWILGSDCSFKLFGCEVGLAHSWDTDRHEHNDVTSGAR